MNISFNIHKKKTKKKTRSTDTIKTPLSPDLYFFEKEKQAKINRSRLEYVLSTRFLIVSVIEIFLLEPKIGEFQCEDRKFLWTAVRTCPFIGHYDHDAVEITKLRIIGLGRPRGWEGAGGGGL